MSVHTTATLDREPMLRWTARAALVSLGADEVAVNSVGADGSLTLVHCTGTRAVAAERSQASTGRGPATSALVRGRVVHIADLHRDRAHPEVRVRALLNGFQSVTAVPLGGFGRINAVLDLWWVDVGEPTESRLAMIEHFQHMTAPILEIVEARDPAYSDPAHGRRRIGWSVGNGSSG